MGLALDEPRDDDEKIQLDGLDVVIDPFALKIINDSGGLNIKNTLFGPSAELEGAAGCG
jgi:Fe-S cluster assembly iron-binding protein IscA